MQPDETAAVAVVGAGMVGVCCALELQRRGLKVRLFDRKRPGQETSYGNAGVFARSSLIPLNNPGLWATLPRLLGNRSPQLRYNPLYMLRQTMWGLRFVSRARPAAFNETATALDSLIRLSMPAHRRLMQEAGVAHRLRDNGWIFLYRSAEAFAGSRFARDVYDRFEIATQELDPPALRDLEPHLRPVFPRALWIKDTCSVDDPGRVVEAYAALFQARGGDLMRQEITALRRVTPGLWQLRGRDGRTTTAHRVVVALGPWANDLLKPLGAAAPLAFERGYHQHFAAAVRRHAGAAGVRHRRRLRAGAGGSGPAAEHRRGADRARRTRQPGATGTGRSGLAPGLSGGRAIRPGMAGLAPHPARLPAPHRRSAAASGPLACHRAPAHRTEYRSRNRAGAGQLDAGRGVPDRRQAVSG